MSVNSEVVSVLYTLDVETVLAAMDARDMSLIRHADGTPLSRDEMTLVKSASPEDFRAAADLARLAAGYARDRVDVAERMHAIVSEHAVSDGETVEVIRRRMSAAVRAEFDALAEIVAPDGYLLQ